MRRSTRIPPKLGNIRIVEKTRKRWGHSTALEQSSCWSFNTFRHSRAIIEIGAAALAHTFIDRHGVIEAGFQRVVILRQLLQR